MSRGSPGKTYDYLLKFLLCGDSDVGKGEILASLGDGQSEASEYNIDCKTTTILLDGRRVKLQLWDTSGQGRFCTIFRSYSRGAQVMLLLFWGIFNWTTLLFAAFETFGGRRPMNWRCNSQSIYQIKLQSYRSPGNPS
uniref:Ras-related protein Rab-40C n=1 Tax=Eptatretus burgeri TaxID=7764 RepID=A0A8C4NB19_EPTBU